MGELAYKICIFGETCVGKTTLARRYLKGYFEENILITMGAEIFVKFIEIEDTKIVLQIWDFGGETIFNFLLPLYSRGASGGIFMFDLSRSETLERIGEWIECFKRDLPTEKQEVPILLVGGKSDLKDQTSISQEEANRTAQRYNLLEYIECSSKTGENVEKIFDTLVRRILGNIYLT